MLAVVSFVKNSDLETFLQLLSFSFPLLSQAFGWSVLGEGGWSDAKSVLKKVKYDSSSPLPSQHDL